MSGFTSKHNLTTNQNFNTALLILSCFFFISGYKQSSSDETMSQLVDYQIPYQVQCWSFVICQLRRRLEFLIIEDLLADSNWC